MDYRKLVDSAREYNIYCSVLFSDKALLGGPVSDLEEQIKMLYEYGKSYPKFSLGFPGVDYWTPQEHVDAAMAACKKYGKY